MTPDAQRATERGPNDEIIHLHDPAYIDLNCHGCNLTHAPHGPSGGGMERNSDAPKLSGARSSLWVTNDPRPTTGNLRLAPVRDMTYCSRRGHPRRIARRR